MPPRSRPAWLTLTILLLHSGCSDPTEEARDVNADAAGDAGDTGDISGGCPDDVWCFTACGVEVAVTDPSTMFGLDAYERGAVRSRDVERAGDLLVSVDGYAVSVRDGVDASLLSERPAPGLLLNVAVIDEVAYAAANSWGLSVVDVSDSGSPVATAFWAPSLDESGRNGLPLVGRTSGQLVFAPVGGISFVDPSDPTAPAERLCLPYPSEYAWTVVVNDDHLVVAGGDDGEGPASAWIYDLAGEATTLEAQLDILGESRVFLDGHRLLLVDPDGDMVLHELGEGGVSVEIARTDFSGRRPDTWNTTEAGGFILGVVRNEGSALAVDMRAADASELVYRGPDPDDAPCIVELSAVESGGGWYLSPWVMPDLRLPTTEDRPDHVCPGADPSLARVLDGAREPTGAARLVLRDDDGETWLVDPSDDSRTLLDIAGDALFWSGGRIVAPMTTGSDFGIPVQSDLVLADPDAPFADPQTLALPAPLVDVTATNERVWVLIESEARDWDEPEIAPQARQLGWLDPSAAPPSLNLLSRNEDDDATLTRLGAAGSRVLAFEEGGDVRIFEPPDDVPALILPLPEGFVLESVTGSSLGAFLADDAGHLLWLDIDGGAIRECSADCGTVFPLAADGAFLYARVVAPVPVGFNSYEGIQVLEPTASGSSFELTAVAAWPIADSSALAFPGPALVVATPQLVTLTLSRSRGPEKTR